MKVVAPSGTVVLLTEDDSVSRSVFRTMLEKAGYIVLEAKDGAECLRMLYTTKRIDVVILDLMMPRVSGWDVMNIKSSDPLIAFIPTICITGLEARAARNKPLDGVSIILEKPFSVEMLLHTLSRLLANGHR